MPLKKPQHKEKNMGNLKGGMSRFQVELKRHTRSIKTSETLDDWAEEKSDFVYIMAYHRDQVIDMFGDEYFIVKIIEKGINQREY
tara:strand:- start:143 stop:397 length:255 start_codon:yes stop_codon:yes gene_type:complete